jgi:uncharacterized protein (TIGR02679 family)
MRRGAPRDNMAASKLIKSKKKQAKERLKPMKDHAMDPAKQQAANPMKEESAERMTVRTAGSTMELAKAYFDKSGFRRVLAAVWKKYESLERIGGRAIIERATEEECEAVNAFFGWNVRPGGQIAVPLALFETELRSSRFAIGLADLHHLLEGKPLLTKSEKRNIRDRKWNRLFADVRHAAGSLNAEAADWLARLENGDGAGVRMLRELYQTDPKEAQAAVEIVLRVLNRLLAMDAGVVGEGAEHAEPFQPAFRVPVRLPVLAARVSGDAHALDLDRPPGRMLLAYLQDKLNETEAGREPAEDGTSDSATLQIRETYRRFGILDDDLSSIVHWFVPMADKPVLPQVWTLRQTEAESNIPACSRIFVTENPSIFSAILDSIGPSIRPDAYAGRPALICTSGPASAAAIRWIRRCLDVSGPSCLLYYAGDFDVKGLSMGQSLYERFPDRFRPWRFDHETYLASARIEPAGPQLDKAELDRLDQMAAAWDDQLCAALRRIGRKVHQEMIADWLVQDFLEYMRCER